MAPTADTATPAREDATPRAAAAPASAAAPGPGPGPGPGPLPAFVPLYQQIKSLLLRSLALGEWQPGQPIPSEVELAARFKVSQGTVRKAIDEMAAENLVVRRQGRGTFVATHAEEGTRYRFLRLATDAGAPPLLRRRLLDCRRMRSNEAVARALRLATGDPVVEVRRLLLDDDKPVVLDHLWLPGADFKGLDASKLEQWRGPLYRLFEAEYSVRMIRAEEKIRAVAAAADEAALLQLPVGAPLLLVERRSFSYGDRPVELRRGLYHTDGHHYRNELN
ncbi:MAG: GntR family transcriptional regulator [Burkholderiales bacterium]|nr:GntR family transcriptional regulator [Burkholderiales bacterium]